MRGLSILLVACLALPVAAGAMPGVQLSLPVGDAGMVGAVAEAGPVKARGAFLVVPGADLENPLADAAGVGPDRLRTADLAATGGVAEGGVWARVAQERVAVPIPLLPDGVLYVGVGTFRDGTGFGAEFLDSIMILERELHGGLSSPSRASATEPALPDPRSAPTDAAGPTLRPQSTAPEASTTDADAPERSSDAFTQASVTLDRASLSTRTLAAITAGVGLGLLALLGLALYSRIRPAATLDNDTRKVIFEAVCENPGLGVQQVSKIADVSYSTATYHLERLAAAGMIVMTPDGNKLRYYKNGGSFTEAERRILPLLKNPEAARVLEAIVEEPGTYRTVLAQRLGVTTTTVNWHLRRLFDAGLVRESRQGRSAFLFPDESAAGCLRSLATKLASEEADVADLARRCAQTQASAN